MKRNFIVILGALGFLGLFGCGGDSGVATNTNTPPANTGTGISITAFSVTPTSVAQNGQVTVSWTVSYTTQLSGYTAEFHVNDQPALISGASGLTRVFSATCDSTYTNCGKSVTHTGTYTKSSANGWPYIYFPSPFTGSRYMNTFDLTKTVYGILNACTWGVTDTVCDTKYVALTFAP